MKDSETGSTWQRLTGVSIDGSLKSKRLTPVQSTHSFWLGWKDYYRRASYTITSTSGLSLQTHIGMMATGSVQAPVHDHTRACPRNF